jgi:hypothetical protein
MDSYQSMNINLVRAAGGLHAFFIENGDVETADGTVEETVLWQATAGPAGWTRHRARVDGDIVYSVAAIEDSIQIVGRAPGGPAVHRIVSRDGGLTWLTQPVWLDSSNPDAHIYLANGRNGGDAPVGLWGMATTRPPEGSDDRGLVYFRLPPLGPADGGPAPGFCQAGVCMPTLPGTSVPPDGPAASQAPPWTPLLDSLVP